MSPNHLNGHVYDTINIIGYPGSGKGTLTKGIKAKNLPLQELVAGDVVRRNVDEKSPLGLEMKTYMDAGELVPDELINAMLLEEAKRLAATDIWTVDGFPRKKSQVEPYKSMIEGHKRQDIAVYLKLAEDPEESERIARARIEKRRLETIANGGDARSDDWDPKTIDRRMKAARLLFPVLEEMKNERKNVVTIDAWRSIEEVREQLAPLLAHLKGVNGHAHILEA